MTPVLVHRLGDVFGGSQTLCGLRRTPTMKAMGSGRHVTCPECRERMRVHQVAARERAARAGLL